MHTTFWQYSNWSRDLTQPYALTSWWTCRLLNSAPRTLPDGFWRMLCCWIPPRLRLYCSELDRGCRPQTGQGLGNTGRWCSCVFRRLTEAAWSNPWLVTVSRPTCFWRGPVMQLPVHPGPTTHSATADPRGCQDRCVRNRRCQTGLLQQPFLRNVKQELWQVADSPEQPRSRGGPCIVVRRRRGAAPHSALVAGEAAG